MKKGFTLVELSIVLVIIGLLIGGILVAQSLVDSAKVQGYIRTLEQYQIAVDLFDERYRGVPGDTDLFVPNGDNDGVLENLGGCRGDYSWYEYDYSFYHLSVAGMLSKEIEIFSPSHCGSGTDDPTVAPRLGMESEFTVGIGYESSLWQALAGTPSPKMGVYLNSNVNAVPGSAWAFDDDDIMLASALDLFSVIAIDTKLDDGEGDSGNLHSVDLQNLGFSCNTGLSSPDGKDCYFEHYWKR